MQIWNGHMYISQLFSGIQGRLCVCPQNNTQNNYTNLRVYSQVNLSATGLLFSLGIFTLMQNTAYLKPPRFLGVLGF
jgi:hypothetical protein